MRLTFALLLVGVGFPAAFTGCSAIDQYVPPVYDIRGSTVLIVPFRNGNHWHYESKEGNRLGQAIEAAMGSECGGLKTIRDRAIQNEIRTDLTDEVNWLDYGRRSRVDYLIVGEIDKVSFENPQMVGMFQGDLRAHYEVWDIQQGIRGFARTLQLRFPEGPDSTEVFISFEQSREEIETALMAEAGRKIAGLLCGYEQEGLPR